VSLQILRHQPFDFLARAIGVGAVFFLALDFDPQKNNLAVCDLEQNNLAQYFAN